MDIESFHEGTGISWACRRSCGSKREPTCATSALLDDGSSSAWILMSAQCHRCAMRTSRAVRITPMQLPQVYSSCSKMGESRRGCVA